jgi:hypothetical protein
MITIKASQKIFTEREIASLTGVCAEHLGSLAKRRNLGFLTRTSEAAGALALQRLFTPWDLNILVTLFRPCTHQAPA